MSFPTITASLSTTFSQEEALHWRLGIPFNPPAGGTRPWGAFAENVARRHFEDLAEVQLGLEQALFSDISEQKPPRDRTRMVQAMEVIFLHFAKQNIPPFLVHELMRFTSSLSDLDRGTVHYSLAPRKVRHRPMLSGDLWEARAHVALAVDIMVGGLMLKKQALAIIDKDYGFLADTLAGGASKFGALVGKWHQELVSGICADVGAQTFFAGRQRYIDFLANQLGTKDPNSLAQNVLKHATLLSARTADSAAITKAAARVRRQTPAQHARIDKKK